MSSPQSKDPVVEEPVTGHAADSDLNRRALRQRIRQQEILAELGVLALQGTSFDELLNATARLTAEGLEAEFCKVMEYLPAAIATKDAFDLPKLASAVIAAGDKVSWDDAAKQVNVPGAGRYPIGIAIEAAGNGATIVRVRLDGVATAAA